MYYKPKFFELLTLFGPNLTYILNPLGMRIHILIFDSKKKNFNVRSEPLKYRVKTVELFLLFYLKVDYFLWLFLNKINCAFVRQKKKKKTFSEFDTFLHQ